MKPQIQTALKVQFCNHNGWFIADIWRIAGAVVVRANGPVSPGNIFRPAEGKATHQVCDYSHCFWRPDLGVFVVPEAQFKTL